MLTKEQNDCVEFMKQESPPLLKVDSPPGSGKSHLLYYIAKELNVSRSLYLVFSREMKLEASEKYKDTTTEVKTTNALAYKYVVAQGLVDDITARSYFNHLLKREGISFTMSNEWDQYSLSIQGYNYLLLQIDSEIAYKIATEFDDWLDKKRDLSVSFGVDAIEEDIPFREKMEILSLLEEYCNSKHIKLKDFLVERDFMNLYSILKKYIKKMVWKEIGVPFFFNLKYYQILLKQGQGFEGELDLLLLDEAADSSQVVLEIFRALPAKKKVMVGDKWQNIMSSFAYSVNGFEYFKKYGVEKKLTKSFRVSSKIAEQLQAFIRAYLDPSYVLEGTDKPYPQHPTTAYLSRTNAGLIQTMIKLHDTDTPYKLTRPVKDVFGLIKVLVYLSPKNSKVFNKKYRYLEDDIYEYNFDPEINGARSTLLAYIKHKHTDNVELQVGISTIYEKGREQILNTMRAAEEMEKRKMSNCAVTVASAHSVKGKEYTEVVINDDFKLEPCLTEPSKPKSLEQRELMLLYFVAVSRATHSLHNAKFLPLGPDDKIIYTEEDHYGTIEKT